MFQKNQFMGKSSIPLEEINEPRNMEVELVDKDGINGCGVLHIVISVTPLLKLTIGLKEIRNLEKTEISWPDPYVIVKKGTKHLYKTKIYHNQRSSLIEEEFTVEKIQKSSHIIFEVYDDNLVKDKLIGIVEVPLQNLVLKDSVPREMSLSINYDLYQTLTFTLKSEGYSQDSKEYFISENEFETSYQEKVKEKYKKEMDKRRQHSHVSKPYFALLEALELKDLNERVKKLKNIYDEFEEKEKNIRKLNRTEKEEATIQFISDSVFSLSKAYLELGKKDEAKELMIRADLYFCSPLITHRLDKLMLKDRKDYYFKNFNRIHVPKAHEGQYLPKIYHPVIGMFFSKESYVHDPYKMFEKVYDEFTDKELAGLGQWKVTNEFHTECYFINFHCIFAVNETYGTVACAFRGTEFDFFGERKIETIIGWVTNFDCSLTDYPLIKGAKVHKGFLQQYLSSKVELMSQFEEYLKKGYQLIISGHSQGAGISGILALECALKFPKYLDKIHHHTFGCPRIGNEAFYKFMNENFKESKRFYSTIDLEEDLITTVPPEKLNFYHYGSSHGLKAKSSFFENVLKEYQKVMLHNKTVYMDTILEEFGLIK